MSNTYMDTAKETYNYTDSERVLEAYAGKAGKRDYGQDGAYRNKADKAYRGAMNVINKFMSGLNVPMKDVFVAALSSRKYGSELSMLDGGKKNYKAYEPSIDESGSLKLDEVSVGAPKRSEMMQYEPISKSQFDAMSKGDSGYTIEEPARAVSGNRSRGDMAAAKFGSSFETADELSSEINLGL